jgi:hypothetical protein
MKIKIKRKVTFEIINQYGVNIGEFQQISEWEGYRKLQNVEGLTLIVTDQNESTLFLKNFLEMFTGEGDEVQASVHKCSPSLKEDLERKA